MASKSKGKTSVPKAPETKEQKFVRIALMRMPKVLKGIKLLGNLAGSGYASNVEQRTKIVKALEAAVIEVASRFEGTKETGGGFEF